MMTLSAISPPLYPSRNIFDLKICIMATAMSKRLDGKTVLITGASSGIGRSTAFEFARTSPQNLKLLLTARRNDSLRQVAADIVKEVGAGVKVLPVQLDISNADEVRTFVGKLPDEFKEIDVLVNNACVFRKVDQTTMAIKMLKSLTYIVVWLEE